jgi:hypothetical protein
MVAQVLSYNLDSRRYSAVGKFQSSRWLHGSQPVHAPAAETLDGIVYLFGGADSAGPLNMVSVAQQWCTCARTLSQWGCSAVGSAGDHAITWSTRNDLRLCCLAGVNVSAVQTAQLCAGDYAGS